MTQEALVPDTGFGLLVWAREARARSLALLEDLTDEQMMGPHLTTVNPPLWEIGHVGWFHERWVLRHALGRPPMRRDEDELWDSIEVEHDTRWDLLLPPRHETLGYAQTVLERISEALDGDEPTSMMREAVLLSIFHEDMHAEAFTYTRQTLGYAAPSWCMPLQRGAGGEELRGDAEVPGGKFMLGAAPGQPYVFDNEKWAHEVQVEPFAIARVPVTQAEFADFVDDGGYTRRELWSDAGWAWREREHAAHPVYWRREGGRWYRRAFDEWVNLEPEHPMVHVSLHEAEAYCHWAGRRLPSEVEWEVAASAEPSGTALGETKRTFPWGETAALPGRAHLDWWGGGTVSVHANEGSDSAFGCRQMIGNVWEWTSTPFRPYPGFELGLYPDYSRPWFETRNVLRGGSWATRGRMVKSTWRNFFEPFRRDVFAGFRTCAPR